MKFSKIFFPRRVAAGFTLVEVLIALAIVSLLIGVMAEVFYRSGRVYTTQNATAALQQEVRAALDIISTEARMAAYRPRKTGYPFKIKAASATRFRFEADLDGNGKLGGYKEDKTAVVKGQYSEDGECENRSYRYSLATTSIQIICGEGSGSQQTETLIGGTEVTSVRVTALDFSYRDKDDAVTTTDSEIRSAVISISAEARAGSVGMIRRTYTTRVQLRNTATNG